METPDTAEIDAMYSLPRVVIPLVCEGGCNPHLYDYDDLRRRAFTQAEFGGDDDADELIKIVREWGRHLRHTDHHQVSPERWSNSGWYRNFRCSVCGHVRRF